MKHVFPAMIHEMFHEVSGNVFCIVSYDLGCFFPCFL